MSAKTAKPKWNPNESEAIPDVSETLAVTIVDVTDLRPSARAEEESDFNIGDISCVVDIQGNEHTETTIAKQGGQNPAWREEFTFNDVSKKYGGGGLMTFKFYDKVSPDAEGEFLGQCSIKLKDIHKDGAHIIPIVNSGTYEDREGAKLNIKVLWTPTKELKVISMTRKFTYFDGSEYTGKFTDGTDPWTNEEYEEPLNEAESNYRCGLQHDPKGKMVWKGSNKNNWYQGGWASNLVAGEGEMHWEDGTVYKGEWHCHKMHGKGKYMLRGVCELPLQGEKGEWNEGMFSGKGKIYWANSGDWYEGEFKDDKFDGVGKYQWGDHEEHTYEGEWKNDKMHGVGRYVWFEDGNKCTYDGELKDDRFSGQGQCFWVSRHEEKYGGGAKYSGAWHQDKMNGRGLYTYFNGDTYEGEFKNNKMHGKGTYTWKSKGYSHSGLWENDVPVYKK